VVWPEVAEPCAPLGAAWVVVVVVLCCVVVVEGELWAAPLVPVWLELGLAVLLSGVLCALGVVAPACPLLCDDGAVAELSGVVVVWLGVDDCPACD